MQPFLSTILLFFLDTPPFHKVTQIDDLITAKEPVLVKYFRPSQLCGFGANLTDSIQFVFKHYRVNKSGCFFMGQVSKRLANMVTLF